MSYCYICNYTHFYPQPCECPPVQPTQTPETEVDRLTRERDEYQNEAMGLMAHQAVLCDERDAALAEAKAARESIEEAVDLAITTERLGAQEVSAPWWKAQANRHCEQAFKYLNYSEELKTKLATVAADRDSLMRRFASWVRDDETGWASRGKKAEEDLATAIAEREEARAQNERTFQALCAAQDSHGDTMRQRDEARSVVAFAAERLDGYDILIEALKTWGMR